MRKVVVLKVSLALALSFGLLSQASAGNASARGMRQAGQSQDVSVAHAPALLFMQRRGMTGARRFAPRRIAERNRRFLYTIKASYPQVVAAKDAKALQFNRAVKDLITEEVNAFKKDFPEPDPETPAEVRENSFDAAYTVDYSGPDLISVSFGISTYFAGAAHPNHHTIVLNYDLNAGRTLKLSDLFKPRSNYMQAISAYTIAALKKKLGPDPDTEWIERGAGPDSENYKNWNITRRGLSVTFDPYQVASYAEGQHVIVIPYTALRNVINPDGPLGPLAKQGQR
ncbi:MAG TPA: RsiV family protein [Pyrinomonadaceae bacterium]